jgi:mRNA interferase MazF
MSGHLFTTVRRGEVWWVQLNSKRDAEIQKTRPAVVLTANALNCARRTLVIVPLSAGPAPRPPIVLAMPSAGVAASLCALSCEQWIESG